jgi:PAS domain S-box-containing protein
MSLILNKLLCLLAPRRREYLAVDKDFNILEKSLGVQRFVECPNELVKGKDVRNCFPELIGLEDICNDILERRQMSFELKGISRSTEKGYPLYLDLYIINNPDKKVGEKSLTIFLEDVTDKMILEQSLVQASNEKSLLLSALAASKDYVDTIITSMADALIVTKSSGIIKTINRAAKDLFGYSEDELIEQPISKIITDINFVKQASQQHPLFNKAFKNVEVSCKTKTGEKITVAFSCSTIQTEAEGLQDLIYIGRDITEHQRARQRQAVQYATTRILSESATIKQAIQKILQAICETLGWDLGEIWAPQAGGGWRIGIGEEDSQTQGHEDMGNSSNILSPSPRLSISASSSFQSPIPTPQLRCVETWGRPSIATPNWTNITGQTTFEAGEGLPGRVWATGSPRWIADVVADSSFLRSEAAYFAGLHGAFGFPIQGDSELLGVMTFYSREIHQTDDDLLQTMVAIGSQVGQFIKRKQAEAALLESQKQTERLLLNILPSPIADRLKQETIPDDSTQTNTIAIAEDFAEVSVMFADIVGFTQLASSLSAIELVDLLNQIFSAFDRLTEKHGLEKIKTVGDAYMVVGGLPTRRIDHAEAIAQMGLDMQTTIADFRNQMGQGLNIRIGINTGPVVAGVIGIKKFSYDLWGDTVNIASRMESHGVAGRIQVTAATYECLREQYWFKERGTIQVKGKGEMLTYFLMGRK